MPQALCGLELKSRREALVLLAVQKKHRPARAWRFEKPLSEIQRSSPFEHDACEIPQGHPSWHCNKWATLIWRIFEVHVMRSGDAWHTRKSSCTSPQHGHKALHTTRCPFWMQFQHLSWMHWSRWKRKSSRWSPRQLILGQAPLVLFGHRRHPAHPRPIPPEDAPAHFYTSSCHHGQWIL